MEKLAPKLLFDMQWNLYKVDTIGAWKKCPLYRDSNKNEYLAKINEEWIFEVKGFHRVKKGLVEWNEKWQIF